MLFITLDNHNKKIDNYENIHCVNPLYSIIDKTDGYIECNFIEESNGNKYLIFVSTDKNKEVLTNYAELWDEIKYLTR